MIGCVGHDGDCCKNRERDKRDAEAEMAEMTPEQREFLGAWG